jgi:hypothetical protein
MADATDGTDHEVREGGTTELRRIEDVAIGTLRMQVDPVPTYSAP